ncbi:MAG: pyrimidine reductase family protein [Nakamurella sp.]
MHPDTPPADSADRAARRPPGGPLPVVEQSHGVQTLPHGADRDDALAELYAWPTEVAHRPVVRANMIASLDGGSTVAGRSAGLGNAADTELFGVLRDLADVILVGSGTVRAEKYGGIRLDERRQARRQRWGLPATPPPLAVVTGNGLHPDLPLFTDTVTPPIIITTQNTAATVPPGVRSVVCGIDRVNFAAAINALAGDGYRRIHCEGGPMLLGQLAAAGLLDECCLTIAPLMLGSAATPLLPIELPEMLRWELAGTRIDGNHLFTRYRRADR